MTERQHVVVGVDGSAGSRAALLHAWITAAGRGADLEVIGASILKGYWLDPYLGDATLGEAARARTEEAVSRVVAEVRRDPAVVAAQAADVPVRIKVLAGSPAQALLTASEDADLLVVGSRGRGAVRSVLLGSVALHCVTHARCPVVVVRPGMTAPESPPRVVVGIDGSDDSRAALLAAVSEAARSDGRVEAVAAYQVDEPWADMSSGSAAVQQVLATVEQRARAFVAEVLDAVVDDDAVRRPEVEVRIVEGPAHEVLLSRAHGAALLVVGSTGSGELRGLLLGSVALSSALHAPCPVMVVPSGANARRSAPERSEEAAVR